MSIGIAKLPVKKTGEIFFYHIAEACHVKMRKKSIKLKKKFACQMCLDGLVKEFISVIIKFYIV